VEREDRPELEAVLILVPLQQAWTVPDYQLSVRSAPRHVQVSFIIRICYMLYVYIICYMYILYVYIICIYYMLYVYIICYMYELYVICIYYTLYVYVIICYIICYIDRFIHI